MSAKIPAELREQMAELGISPTEAIRKALKQEVERKMRQQLFQKIEKASPIISKVSQEAWVKAVRESRDQR